MITIIDYNSGNLTSVKNALTKLGFEFHVSLDAEEIAKADKIIFPGQGHSAQAMAELKKLNLVDVIKNFKKPFLGICVGMQLLYEFSEEGETECLGVIKGRVRRFEAKPPKSPRNAAGSGGLSIKIPQMGWNNIKIRGQRSVVSDQYEKLRILENIPDDSYFYFVHSYYCPVNEYTLATCEYGNEFSAIINKDNFYGTQFHPEKSGEVGMRLLRSFCEI